MKICVDENIPLITAAELTARGHDVLDIRGTANQGVSDDLLWELAQKDGRLLISTDKGFAQRRGSPHSGILIIRLRQPNERKIHARVMHALGQFAADEWPGLIVVTRDAVQSVWRA